MRTCILTASSNLLRQLTHDARQLLTLLAILYCGRAPKAGHDLTFFNHARRYYAKHGFANAFPIDYGHLALRPTRLPMLGVCGCWYRIAAPTATGAQNLFQAACFTGVLCHLGALSPLPESLPPRCCHPTISSSILSFVAIAACP